jgi:hypothetical protein
MLPIDDTPDRKASTLLIGVLAAAVVAFGLVWWWLSK